MSATDDFEVVEFLRARLAEDEAEARAATAGPWRHDPDKHHRRIGTAEFSEAVFAGPAGSAAICVAETGETDDVQSMWDARHIARHDPARVLREVEAKRQIIKLAVDADHVAYEDGYNANPMAVLRPLAAVYSDHPDYRPEWAA